MRARPSRVREPQSLRNQPKHRMVLSGLAPPPLAAGRLLYQKRSDTAAEMGLNVADKGPRGPVFRPHDGARLACGPSAAETGLNVADKGPRGPVFRPHDGARLACGPSVGEIAVLAESSTYVGKY